VSGATIVYNKPVFNSRHQARLNLANRYAAALERNQFGKMAISSRQGEAGVSFTGKLTRPAGDRAFPVIAKLLLFSADAELVSKINQKFFRFCRVFKASRKYRLDDGNRQKLCIPGHY
jgi:hypothetical protein